MHKMRNLVMQEKIHLCAKHAVSHCKISKKKNVKATVYLLELYIIKHSQFNKIHQSISEMKCHTLAVC